VSAYRSPLGLHTGRDDAFVAMLAVFLIIGGVAVWLRWWLAEARPSARTGPLRERHQIMRFALALASRIEGWMPSIPLQACRKPICTFIRRRLAIST
jgi:hypothetical protein